MSIFINNKTSTWKTNILLSVFSLIFMSSCLELALRTYDAMRGESFFKTKGNIFDEPSRPVIPFRTFGFDPYLKEETGMLISSYWRETYRLHKQPGTYRIVCFGGSTTQMQADSIHYPKQLESLLRERLGREDIEVINVANPAYATPHSIILLALDVLSWHPDLVILSHNINDLTVGYWPDFRPDYWNKYSDDYYRIPDYSERYSWVNIIFQHSRLYWLVLERIDRIDQSNQARSELKRKSYGNLPVEEAAEVFQRNLKTFVHLAKSRNIEVLLGSQPLEPSEEYFRLQMAYKPYNKIVIYPQHHEFIKHHRHYNRIIEKVAAEMNVGFVDNDKIFNNETKYFIDFVHYTAEGIDRLAENYVDAIINQYMQPAVLGFSKNPHR